MPGPFDYDKGISFKNLISMNHLKSKEYPAETSHNYMCQLLGRGYY